jgi:thioredoxin
MHASATKSAALLVACPECHTLVRVPEDRLGDDPTCARCKSAVITGMPVTLDSQSFDTHTTRSGLPVLVDFWAPWCGPCRAIAPIVDELAGEYAGKLKVVKMNVDDNPRTPAQYGVRGIPNLILFKDGQVAQQIVGAVPKAQLVKAITTVVV